MKERLHKVQGHEQQGVKVQLFPFQLSVSLSSSHDLVQSLDHDIGEQQRENVATERDNSQGREDVISQHIVSNLASVIRKRGIIIQNDILGKVKDRGGEDLEGWLDETD